MSIQLQQAFEKASKLPLIEQNIVAEALMSALYNYDVLNTDGENHWDELLQSEASQRWLEKMAAQVEEEISRGDVFDFNPAKRLPT
jgi:anthranilate/para-aminobenzoate synthase component I